MKRWEEGLFGGRVGLDRAALDSPAVVVIYLTRLPLHLFTCCVGVLKKLSK